MLPYVAERASSAQNKPKTSTGTSTVGDTLAEAALVAAWAIEKTGYRARSGWRWKRCGKSQPARGPERDEIVHMKRRKVHS